MLFSSRFKKSFDGFYPHYGTAIIKLFLLALLLISLFALKFNSAIAQSDLSRIGISNDNLKTKGDEIFGATDEQASLEKIRQMNEATKKEIANQFCDQPPTDELCSIIPMTIWILVNCLCICLFWRLRKIRLTFFSWQTFIGLNWPLDSNGKPSASVNGGETGQSRAWFNFKTPQQVFAPRFMKTIFVKISVMMVLLIC